MKLTREERAELRRGVVQRTLNRYAEIIREFDEDQLRADHLAHMRASAPELAAITRGELLRRGLEEFTEPDAFRWMRYLEAFEG
jgi:hypothetical protein